MTTEVVQADAHCIGPACMMWRWQGFRDGEEFDGFCGLAGRAGAP